jgi:ABC-2 type transport system ATP-binding protein
MRLGKHDMEPTVPPTTADAEPPRDATTAPVMPGPVLRCSGLRKSFGDRVAVAGVGFEIASGETYGLLGPNGAGKTTTISMICGLLRRDAGEVFVAGRPIDIGTTTAKGAIGFVPQDLAIYPDLTARENLRFFGRLEHLRGKELDRRVDEVLEVIGLTDRAKDRVESYSGGMKRRLNIGIGLLHHPRLLVLDEPTVGVDPQSRNAILSSIADLEGEGMAILYTTHYMEEAERLCDRIGIIDQGTIQAEGTRRELIDLIGGKDRVVLTAGGTLAPAAEALRRLDARIAEVTISDGRIEVIVVEARSILPAMLDAVASAGAAVRSVEVVEPDLEAVFLHLTGKALRD